MTMAVTAEMAVLVARPSLAAGVSLEEGIGTINGVQIFKEGRNTDSASGAEKPG